MCRTIEGQIDMPRPIFRLLAGLVSIGFVIVGVSLAIIYDDLWSKFCFGTLAISGLFYGFYAVRGK